MTSYHLYFRIASPADATQVKELVESAFRAEDSRPNWTGDMLLPSNFSLGIEDVSKAINHPDGAVLIAMHEDNVLVASIQVSKRGLDYARLAWLAVDPRAHRGGIGRQVLEYAEAYCRKTWGVTRLGLDALSTREALISWYLRRGYRKTGELVPFPKKEVNGVALPDDLCFVEMEKRLD
jgi:ribosomal protein S18 acetylase RimI-like enzyme